VPRPHPPRLAAVSPDEFPTSGWARTGPAASVRPKLLPAVIPARQSLAGTRPGVSRLSTTLHHGLPLGAIAGRRTRLSGAPAAPARPGRGRRPGCWRGAFTGTPGRINRRPPSETLQRRPAARHRSYFHLLLHVTLTLEPRPGCFARRGVPASGPGHLVPNGPLGSSPARRSRAYNPSPPVSSLLPPVPVFPVTAFASVPGFPPRIPHPPPHTPNTLPATTPPPPSHLSPPYILAPRHTVGRHPPLSSQPGASYHPPCGPAELWFAFSLRAATSQRPTPRPTAPLPNIFCPRKTSDKSSFSYPFRPLVFSLPLPAPLISGEGHGEHGGGEGPVTAMGCGPIAFWIPRPGRASAAMPFRRAPRPGKRGRQEAMAGRHTKDQVFLFRPPCRAGSQAAARGHGPHPPRQPSPARALPPTKKPPGQRGRSRRLSEHPVRPDPSANDAPSEQHRSPSCWPTEAARAPNQPQDA